MRLFETTETADLPPVPADLRARILAGARDAATHRTLMGEMAAMTCLETQDAPAPAALGADITVAAWNLERCLDVDGSADLLRAQAPDVVLLSEMDSGMARTAQRNTTRDLAAALGMGYAYGLEFYEIGLGSPSELGFCQEDHNAAGWHGNAVLFRAAPLRLALVRLDDHGHWYRPDCGADPGQPRVGGRNAIIAVLAGETGPTCVVSTHLESNAGAAHRQSQMDRLIAAIDAVIAEFGDMPVVIGGDLNTGNGAMKSWREETLFESSARHGFCWDGNPDGMTTRPSRITRHPERQYKLDWFAHRGVDMTEGAIIASLDPAGLALSDHDLITGRFLRR